jgi:hypothetical protein
MKLKTSAYSQVRSARVALEQTIQANQLRPQTSRMYLTNIAARQAWCCRRASMTTAADMEAAYHLIVDDPCDRSVQSLPVLVDQMEWESMDLDNDAFCSYYDNGNKSYNDESRVAPFVKTNKTVVQFDETTTNPESSYSSHDDAVYTIQEEDEEDDERSLCQKEYPARKGRPGLVRQPSAIHRVAKSVSARIQMFGGKFQKQPQRQENNGNNNNNKWIRM